MRSEDAPRMGMDDKQKKDSKRCVYATKEDY